MAANTLAIVASTTGRMPVRGASDGMAGTGGKIWTDSVVRVSRLTV
jgi:hypothetical protein